MCTPATTPSTSAAAQDSPPATHEPVYYGPDPDAAYNAVLSLRHASDLLTTLAPASAEEALDRLRATLVAHHTRSGVLFDSRAWIVTARRT